MELNESKDRELGIVHQEASLKQGLQHMQMAHTANKKDPVVLNMLANHFFLTKEFAKVRLVYCWMLDMLFLR